MRLQCKFRRWAVQDDNGRTFTFMSDDDCHVLDIALARMGRVVAERTVNISGGSRTITLRRDGKHTQVNNKTRVKRRVVCNWRRWFVKKSERWVLPDLNRQLRAEESAMWVGCATVEGVETAVEPLLKFSREPTVASLTVLLPRLNVVHDGVFTGTFGDDPTFPYTRVVVTGLQACAAPRGAYDRLLATEVPFQAPAIDVLEDQSGELVLNPAKHEIMLLHGTSQETAATIAAEGFRASREGAYGPGVYLTDNLHKATNYGTAIRQSDGSVIRHVVVCRVLMGNALVARDKCRSGLQRGDGAFDSIVAPQTSILESGNFGPYYNEFVVFDTARVLPMFIARLTCFS